MNDFTPYIATPSGVWTIALVSTDYREVHFGVFTDVEDARTALESGLVTTHPGERLSLRRIRPFPTD